MATRNIKLTPIDILDSYGCPIPLRAGMPTRFLALPYEKVEARGVRLPIAIATDAHDGARAMVGRWIIDFIRGRRDDDPLTSYLLAGLIDYGRDNDTGTIIFGDGEEIITATLNPEPCPDTEYEDDHEEDDARHPKAGRPIREAALA